MNTPAISSRRNPVAPPRRATKITIPERVGPHVKLVFSEMQRQRITYDEVEIGSGVNRPTIKAWRHKNRPNLDSIEAVLGFLGWDMVPLLREAVIPSEIVARLRPLAEELGLAMPDAVRLMAEIATRDHHLDAIREANTPEAV